MNKSEQINELAQALCNFQMEKIEIVKNKKAHNSMYADLTQILEKTREPLNKHKLSVTQIADTTNDNNKVVVETVLMHNSGQFISGRLEMDIDGVRASNKAQAAGMVVTYARRYGYSAILGIAADDDTDAQSDVQQRGRPNSQQSSVANSNTKATKEQVDELLYKLNDDKEKIKKIMDWGGVKNIYDLSFDKYSLAINKINNDANKSMGGTA